MWEEQWNIYISPVYCILELISLNFWNGKHFGEICRVNRNTLVSDTSCRENQDTNFIFYSFFFFFFENRTVYEINVKCNVQPADRRLKYEPWALCARYQRLQTHTHKI
jgi:hypothetical protein